MAVVVVVVAVTAIKEQPRLRSGEKQTVLPTRQKIGAKVSGPWGFTNSKKTCMAEAGSVFLLV